MFLTKDELKNLLAAGLIQSVQLVGVPCKVRIAVYPSFCVAIQFTTVHGKTGFISTSRFDMKVFRIESALALLHELQVESINVNIPALFAALRQ